MDPRGQSVRPIPNGNGLPLARQHSGRGHGSTDAILAISPHCLQGSSRFPSHFHTLGKSFFKFQRESGRSRRTVTRLVPIRLSFFLTFSSSFKPRFLLAPATTRWIPLLQYWTIALDQWSSNGQMEVIQIETEMAICIIGPHCGIVDRKKTAVAYFKTLCPAYLRGTVPGIQCLQGRCRRRPVPTSQTCLGSRLVSVISICKNREGMITTANPTEEAQLAKRSSAFCEQARYSL